MAVSQAQKLKAATMLGAGATEAEVVAEVGVSRSTVQAWKRKPEFQSLIEKAQQETGKQALISHGKSIIAEVQVIKEREPVIRDRIWSILDGMLEITQTLVERAKEEEISVRSLPALTDSTCKLVNAFTDLDDRIGSLEVIGNAVIKMGSENSPTTTR